YSLQTRTYGTRLVKGRAIPGDLRREAIHWSQSQPAFWRSPAPTPKKRGILGPNGGKQQLRYLNMPTRLRMTRKTIWPFCGACIRKIEEPFGTTSVRRSREVNPRRKLCGASKTRSGR